MTRHLPRRSSGESRRRSIPGTSLDAKLVLLTLHAKVIQPSVVDVFQLESSAETLSRGRPHIIAALHLI